MTLLRSHSIRFPRRLCTAAGNHQVGRRHASDHDYQLDDPWSRYIHSSCPSISGSVRGNVEQQRPRRSGVRQDRAPALTYARFRRGMNGCVVRILRSRSRNGDLRVGYSIALAMPLPSSMSQLSGRKLPSSTRYLDSECERGATFEWISGSRG